MKALTMTQQVLLVVAVVILVFIVGLVYMYRPAADPNTPDRGPGPAQEQGHLKFTRPRVQWELDRGETGEFESDVPGHHDFWFHNDRDVPVQLGLNWKNCHCSNVKVCLAPDKHKAPEEPERSQLSWKQLDTADTEGIEVPPGARGWVRLGWISDKLGLERLEAIVWTRMNKEPGKVLLELPVNFVRAVQLLPAEFPLGELSLGSGERTFDLICWSPTRHQFSLKPEPASHRCITCGQPVELKDEERKALETQAGRPVRCAYRVPVTVRERIDENTQLDLGPFREEVVLSVTEPVKLRVSSNVSGKVSDGALKVPMLDGASRINLKSFSANEEKTLEVFIESPRSDLELKLDEKTSDFLKASKVEVDSQAGTQKTWKLTVKVPANSAPGRFPNDLEGFRDCAVYLQISRDNQPWRRIRIPVEGNAQFGR